jgi:hypothetical protein
MENSGTPANTSTRRPALLSVLCILTFLCSGAATLLSLVGIFASSWILDMLTPFVPGLASYSSSFLIVFFFILVVIWGLSLWGAIVMFNRRKGGFVLYLIPNGLLLILQIILTISAFNVFFLLFVLISILFIVLYATQVKFLKE